MTALPAKPRTSKQKATAKKYGTRTMRIETARAHARAKSVPQTSWWIGLGRDEFSAQVQEQAGRMVGSPFSGSTLKMID